MESKEIAKEWTWGNATYGLASRAYNVPTCPTCGEPTYSMLRCPFCDQKLKDPDERRMT